MTSTNGLTAQFYKNERYSDVIIKFGEHQVRAHRVILVQQSGYFSTAFFSLFQVASSPIIDLGDEDDAELLESVFRYLYYHGPVQDQFQGPVHKCKIPVYQLIDIYLLADKYDISGLHRAAGKVFYDLTIAGLRKGAHATFKSVFIDCIARICGPSYPQLADGQLQITVLNICRECYTTLFKNNTFLQRYSRGELFDARNAAALGW